MCAIQLLNFNQSIPDHTKLHILKFHNFGPIRTVQTVQTMQTIQIKQTMKTKQKMHRVQTMPVNIDNADKID